MSSIRFIASTFFCGFGNCGQLIVFGSDLLIANPVVPEEDLFECQTTSEMVEFIRRWFKEGEAIVPVPIVIEAKEIAA